jgi:hypothetical protein
LTSRVIAVVNTVLHVNLSFSVPLERFTISEGRNGSVVMKFVLKHRWSDG